MKFVIGFIFGAAVGAIVALLYAPSTGDELRTNIKTQADTQYAKLQEEWQKGLGELQSRVDKVSSDLQAMAENTKPDAAPPETEQSAA